MERNTKPANSHHPLQDSPMATEVMGAWRNATTASSVPRERQVDDRRYIHSVDPMQGSGFAYPGLISRIHTGAENGANDQEADRKTSFNQTSETEQS
jgi:hypothetical protein